MRLAQLSERSGVSTATIKYYLREGLLAPGRQINATTAEYDDEHLRRLKLIRAMIQIGRVPVATVREVLGHVDDDSLPRSIRLGAALWALPQVPEPDEDDEYFEPHDQKRSRVTTGLLVALIFALGVLAGLLVGRLLTPAPAPQIVSVLNDAPSSAPPASVPPTSVPPSPAPSASR